jgi:hypothetical protein
MPPDPVAVDRSDLIKRLFAVSLSVGFATQITRMAWLIAGRAPSSEDIPDLILLITSLIIVVLSWDGYLPVLRRYPLKDRQRFFLDIMIVFFYLILLQSSHGRAVMTWLYIINIIFILYILWDIFTMRVAGADYEGLGLP